MQELIDQQIDHYLIEELIGQGGIAKVFKAYDERFKRHVAVKMLNRSELDIELVKERFEQEGQIIASLEHYAIVPVYDFGEHEGRPFIVMRLMRGGSLQERVTTGPLSLATTVEIFDRICPALDRAHDNGIIHRDIKPANILFDSDDVAFLADFGMARFTQLTLSGMIIGSPHYMSPEQAQGKVLDRRSDIYQLGVVLYEMLTGRVPFDGESIEAVLYQHVHEPPVPVRELVPDISEAIEELVEQVLAKDPLDRIPTAGEVAGRLRELVVLDESATLRPTMTPQPRFLTKSSLAMADTLRDTSRPEAVGPDPSRPMWGWIAGVLAVLAAAFIMVGVWNAFAQPVVESTPAGEVGAAVGGGSASRATEQPEAILVVDPPETPTPALEPTATMGSIPTLTPLLPPLLISPADFAALTGSDRIVYAANPEEQYDIFSWGAEPAPQRLTTIEVDDFRPIWSPDGEWIVYHSRRRDWEIYIMDAGGGSKQNLTNNPAQDTFAQWTPDGRLLFQSNRIEGQFDLFIMDVDGQNIERLTPGGKDETDPAVSADGRIAYVSPVMINDAESVPQIFVMELDGSGAKQITFDDRWGSFAPSWSPDGSRIAFYSTRTDGIPSIFVMEADGSLPVLLTDITDPSFYPSWSANGEWILFHRLMESEGAAEEDGNRDLWMVRVDGSELVRLTETADIQERMPAFKR